MPYTDEQIEYFRNLDPKVASKVLAKLKEAGELDELISSAEDYNKRLEIGGSSAVGKGKEYQPKKADTFMDRLRGAAKKYPWVSPIGSAALAATESGKTGSQRADSAIGALLNTPISPSNYAAKAMEASQLPIVTDAASYMPAPNIGRFIKPIHDVPVGALQKVLALGNLSGQESINQEDQALQQYYNQNVSPSAMGELAGNVALAAPALGSQALSAVPQSANALRQLLGIGAREGMVGGVLGAAQPVASTDRSQILKQMLSNARSGAAMGAGMGMGLHGLTGLANRASGAANQIPDVRTLQGSLKGSGDDTANIMLDNMKQKMEAERPNAMFQARDQLADQSGVTVGQAQMGDRISQWKQDLERHAKVIGQGQDEAATRRLGSLIDELDAKYNQPESAVPFSEMAADRSALREELDRFNMDPIFAKKGVKLISDMKKGLGEAGHEAATASGIPQLAQMDTDATKAYAGFAKKWKDRDIQGILETGNADEAIRKFATQGTDRAEKVLSAMGPEGKRAVQSQLLDSWIDQSGGDPQKFLSLYAKNKKAADVFFDGQEREMLVGLLKVQQAAEKASKITPYVLGGIGAAAGQSHPYAGYGGGAAALGMAKVFTPSVGKLWSSALSTEMGQNLLLSAAKTDANSMAMRDILSKIGSLSSSIPNPTLENQQNLTEQ